MLVFKNGQGSDGAEIVADPEKFEDVSDHVSSSAGHVTFCRVCRAGRFQVMLSSVAVPGGVHDEAEAAELRSSPVRLGGKRNQLSQRW